MSMNELKKKGNHAKYGAIAAATGGVLSFIFLHWIIGVGLLGLAGYLFWQMIKNYAETGRRL